MQEMSGSTCVLELKKDRERERECVEGVKSKLWIKSLCFSLGRFFFFFKKKKKEDIIKNVKCGTWDEKKKKRFVLNGKEGGDRSIRWGTGWYRSATTCNSEPRRLVGSKSLSDTRPIAGPLLYLFIFILSFFFLFFFS